MLYESGKSSKTSFIACVRPPRRKKLRARTASEAPIRDRLGDEAAFSEASRSAATIIPFNAAVIPKMAMLKAYSDDVKLERYSIAPRTYLGELRQRIIGDRPGASTMRELVSGALPARFPLAQKMPLPRLTLKASTSPPQMLP